MSEWGLDRIERVFIDRKLEQSQIAMRARELFSREQITWVDDEPLTEKKGELSAPDFEASKRLLFITEFKGRFFKRCPGARPGLTCCNYFVLNLGSQCNMNCSYCYLQSFVNSPVMKIYANIETALDELSALGKDLGNESLRVGTGETTDSLSFDPLTLYSRRLIEYFRNYPNWRLEFKTKSSQVEQFLNVEHAGNVVVSFSINPQNVIEHEEYGTASLESRLRAARIARDKKFQVAFHIDPMIWHLGWQDSYRSLVRQVCATFAPQDINVISVGALRFQPEQRHMMRERFWKSRGDGQEWGPEHQRERQPTSWVVGAEMFSSSDGKLRYDQRLREEMLHFVVNEFRQNSREWPIFLCMETPEVWLNAMNSLPKSNELVAPLFNHSLTRKFNAQIRN